MPLEFSKYQGLGNDFILVDNRHQGEPCLRPEQAARLCDRNFGVGADGVIFLLSGSGDADYAMRIFNADGSEPEMCGNGIRCLAKFAARLEAQDQGNATATPGTPNLYRIQTPAGLISPEIQPNGLVRVDMGPPELHADRIPTTLAGKADKVIDLPLRVGDRDWQVTCVSMGNPHCVTFVDDVTTIPLEVLGPRFEHHPAFPQRVNTEFIQVQRPDYLKMRVWERGAGSTLACGTGACAALVAAVLTGRSDRHATLELPGGLLEIEWVAETNRVIMTGPASLVFTGSLAD